MTNDKDSSYKGEEKTNNKTATASNNKQARHKAVPTLVQKLVDEFAQLRTSNA